MAPALRALTWIGLGLLVLGSLTLMVPLLPATATGGPPQFHAWPPFWLSVLCTAAGVILARVARRG